MFESPCQFCTNRKIPKTCESSCELWQKYEAEKKILQEKLYNENQVKKDILSNHRRRICKFLKIRGNYND